MARNVYFSFHYQDVKDFRANVVRKSGRFRKRGDKFHDASIHEEVDEKKVKVIKALIDEELKGIGVTCVLIGSDTYSRRWVRYELVKSFEMKKGQLGVGINWIKDNKGNTKFWPGENPFNYLKLKISNDGKTIDFFEYKNGSWIKYRDLTSIKNSHFKEKYFGQELKFSDLYKKYSYSWDEGKLNLTSWIEHAALNAGR